MKNAEDINMYKGLAYYFLPDGVLEYFDVVDFAESLAPDGEPYGCRARQGKGGASSRTVFRQVPGFPRSQPRQSIKR